MTRKEMAIKVAWHYLGLPYRWGGDDPIQGFDCSGLVVEILKSIGILPRIGDWTAESLYEFFKKHGKLVTRPDAGCLAFWIDRGTAKIRHIEMFLNSEVTIGASGGGSKTKSLEAAIDQNAYIKIRPVDFTDPELFGFCDPF